MKNKFTNIIMILIIIAIIIVFGLFGMMIYEDIKDIDVSSEVEKLKTDVNTSSDTIYHNIETPKIIENKLDGIQEVNKNTNLEEIDYNNIKVNKYFFNQLDNYSKTIYKAFESNKENMKKGTYQINLGTSFSSLLSKENGQDELGRYYQSAIEAYTYDNPDVFYLSPNKMYLNIETTTKGNNKTYNIYINSGDEENYLIDEFNSKEEIDEAILKIENTRKEILSNRSGNTYEDIKMIHDYLIDNIEYDSSVSEKHIYNIYGALVNGKCVCEGYAKALKYLLDGLNIESTLIAGKGTNSEGKTENHAWNYVKLDDKWYAIDSTWDDPVVIGGGTISKSSRYKYFLKGEENFSIDHIPSGQFTPDGKEFSYPDLSKKAYE